MRQVVWQAPHRLEVLEVAPPEPGAKDIVLAVAACGICGSDVHSFTEGSWISAGNPRGANSPHQIATS